MYDLTNSPNKNNENLEIKEYIQYTDKIPDINLRIHTHNCCHHCCCKCKCHFMDHNNHNLYHNISFSNLNYINPIDRDLYQQNNNIITRNKSANNLKINKIRNSFDNQKKIYYNNINVNRNYKIYDDKIDNHKYMNNYPGKIENYNNNYRNMKYLKNNSNKNNVNNTNYLNSNKKNNHYTKFRNGNLSKNLLQIKRKQLSKFYHIRNPKKYFYGGKLLQTASNPNNHKFKEIIGRSKSKDKNLIKNKIINFNDKNISYDAISRNENNENLGINNNYQYKSFQKSPKYLNNNTTFYDSNKKKNDLESSEIVQETNNTRLVNLKYLKKSPTEKYLYNSNEKIKHRNNLDKYLFKKNNDLENKYNSYSKNENNTNNNYNINKLNNNEKYEYKINNNFQKSYSLTNLNTNNSNSINLKTIFQNEYDSYNNSNNNDYSSLNNKNHIIEHEKQNILKNRKNLINEDYLKDKKYLEKYLNRNNKKKRIIKDNSIIERTKKLLRKNKLENEVNNLNKINYKDFYGNRILYSLKNNFIERNNDYNKNIVKPKLKIGKP